MPAVVTGAGGFIGHAISAALLACGEDVVGIDNLGDYYSVQLKRDRIADLKTRFKDKFTFLEVDFSDVDALAKALKPHRAKINKVIHMGAQPGVRYSLENPQAYVQANLVGHLN